MTERTPGQADTASGGYPEADSPRYPQPLSARPTDTRPRTGEPPLAAIGSWLVLSASFGLSAATWIALATLAGFDGQVHVSSPLGVATLRLAWLMPVAIDGYVVVALVLWTAPVPARIADFARKNTYAAAGLGVVAQSAYHALTAWSATGVLWRALLAAVVGAMVPGVAALTVHLRALVRRESGRWRKPETDTGTDIRADTAVSAPADMPQIAPTVRADTPADIRPDMPAPARRTPAADTSNVTPIAGRTRRGGQATDVSIENLADTLAAAFPGQAVGQPTALTELKRVHGSCSRGRAIEAKNIHNARVTGQVADTPPAERADSDDDQERELALATATA